MKANNSVLTMFGTAVIMLAMLTQFSGASGLGWILYGTVTNAATCNVISGATVGSPYNDYGFNITNSTGGYRLVLGTGNWSVTVSAAGYNNGSYLTPYYTNGAWMHNFSLIPIGGTARSTPCSGGSTVVNSTPTTITPGVNPTSTVAATTITNTSALTPSSPSTSGSTEALIAVVVIIIIIVVAYLLMKGGKKKPAEHHAHHTEASK